MYARLSLLCARCAALCCCLCCCFVLLFQCGQCVTPRANRVLACLLTLVAVGVHCSPCPPTRPLQAVNITRTHDAWIAECTEKATALRDWIAETKTAYGEAELGNTAADIKALLDGFNEYLSGTKPTWKQKRVELAGLFNAFFASARNNDRPLYKAPAGLNPPELSSQWAALEEAEGLYERTIRAQYRTFVTVEGNVAKLDAKVAKLNEWMGAQEAVFSSGEYGASLTATETLIAAYEAFETQLAQQQQAVASLKVWAATDGIDGHAQYEATQATVAQVEESLAAIAEQGAQYREYLGLTQESHDKLGQLDEVSTWMTQKSEFFGEGKYVSMPRCLCCCFFLVVFVLGNLALKVAFFGMLLCGWVDVVGFFLCRVWFLPPGTVTQS